MQTYSIKANRTPQDVLANNDEVLETGYTLDEARIASIATQKTGEFICVWIEPDETKPEPRIVRSVERDHTGALYTVTRCDGWHI